MIGLIMNGVLGGVMRSFLGVPCACLGSILAIFAICGCVRCMKCRTRDCGCLKRCFRVTGHDKFDDFEFLMLVHEAIFEHRGAKMTTVVRVTAGLHTVRTDPNSNGIFQQPLTIFVEQGTRQIVVDLMDTNGRVLASLCLDPQDNILTPKNMSSEQVFNMKQNNKTIRNPKMKLSMVVSTGNDAELGLVSGVRTDVDILVRQQLLKAKEVGKANNSGKSDEDLSEMEVLKEACCGPLEIFEGLGKTSSVHVAIVGPPTSRRYVLGIWDDKHDFESKRKAIEEVDLLKIQSVQADPTRHHVFVVNYFDEGRVPQTLTFRRIDRARDVWVEILYLLVTRARDSLKKTKRDKTLAVDAGGGARRALTTMFTRGGSKTQKKAH